MRYCIVINDKLKEEYSTLEEAQLNLTKQLDKLDKQEQQKQSTTKSNVKFKKPDIKLIQIPDISIGLKIYSNHNQNGETNDIKFVGEIIDESDNLWFTKKSENEQISTPCYKFVGHLRGELDA